ncbi:MAG TPA: radical SAM protein [Gaiellales bacterium]|nr:radical SAM protein [Gaiellales bacterium]
MTAATSHLGLAPPDLGVAPITVAWETTRACHLRCIHCRAVAQPRRDDGELTTDEGRDLIGQAADMGTRVFVLTGGDPLMRPDILELIAAAADSGMHCGFAPSVTRRLTAAALGAAVSAGANTIHLSLDGASASTHDGFRGVPGAFARTLAAMDTVAALGARLQVGTTVTRRSAGELELIARSIAGRVTQWTLFFLVPTGRAALDQMLSPSEHERVLRWLADADLPFAARTVAAPTYRRVRAELGRAPVPGANDGNGFAFVSHRGDICPSGFLQLAAANVRQARLADTYRRHPLFVSLRDPSQLNGRCGRCAYTTLCGGSRARAWAVTGDPLADDPSCPLVAAEQN